MPLQLTARDREVLAGSHGAGARMAMSIVVRMAEVQEAPRCSTTSGRTSTFWGGYDHHTG